MKAAAEAAMKAAAAEAAMKATAAAAAKTEAMDATKARTKVEEAAEAATCMTVTRAAMATKAAESSLREKLLDFGELSDLEVDEMVYEVRRNPEKFATQQKGRGNYARALLALDLAMASEQVSPVIAFDSFRSLSIISTASACFCLRRIVSDCFGCAERPHRPAPRWRN